MTLFSPVVKLLEFTKSVSDPEPPTPKANGKVIVPKASMFGFNFSLTVHLIEENVVNNSPGWKSQIAYVTPPADKVKYD